MAFTKEQQLAIDTEGSNIIVSAGAGSGKTAVLTERVIRKLKNGIDVDRLLVLTFTNEAANEMKSRIREAIITNKLDKQLDLLDSSYITTFDSFALSIVKKYHYLLNIGNNIKIIDSNVITIYKNKKIDEIFEKMYGNQEFDSLINDFCLKDDKSIKKFIIDISMKLELLIDKKEYLDNYIKLYFSDEYISKLINDYNLIIKNKTLELNELYEKILSYIDDSLILKLDKWFKSLFMGNNYEEYLLFKSMPTVRFSKVNEDGVSLKELIKDKIDEIKELLRFDSIEEIKDSILSIKNYIKVIIDVINQLDNYIFEYKDKHGIYEFNDISHMAIQIVKNNPEISKELTEYFNEIMVDEYQDTSSIQEEFISYISNNNVYMVGDIKQSIYRFRNANPYIFQDKYDKYSLENGGIKIDLLKNFRSRSETLFNINEIFNLIMDQEIGNANYINGHNMLYGNYDYDKEDTKQNNMLEIYNYKTDEDEEYTKEEKELFIISEDIINKINNKYQVFDKKSKCLRDIKYSDICIITDRNKYLPMYKKILEYHGISSVIYMDEILTNDMVVLVLKNLISLVDYANKEIFDDKFRYLFTSVARSFLFNYSDNNIYQIYNNKSYKESLIVSKCKEINTYNSLITIINNIIEKFDVYEKLTILPDIEKNIVRITNLIDIADSLSELGYSIYEFVNYLEDTIKMDLSVKYSVNTGGSNSVKIMNIHKSKGLEFPLCYFTGMHNKFTIKEISSKYLISNKYGIILPYIKNNELENTILRDLYKDEYFKEEISEKIRLFYVALTRCREKMIIVTSISNDRKGYNHIVPFFDRIKYRSFIDILNSIDVIDKYIVNKSAKYTHEYDKINLKELNIENKDEILEKRTITTNYIKTENKRFSKKQNKIMDIDEIKTMEYGTKLHEIFEYEDFFNPKNKYVLNLLKKVDNNFINVYKEYEFTYTDNEIVYYGIIDLMLEYDNSIYIIDYKLKNIDNLEYKKQLNGYRDYISSITDKKVNIYLYSIIDDKLLELM